MTADLAEFGDAGFNSTQWINASCRSKPADDPMEKYLAELEMRLQLTAEEIESSLQDHSVTAMRRIPFAVQEVYRLQGDIQGLQDQVQVLAGTVARDAGEAAASVETIKGLDRVKRNMEAACSTLKEATELSGLFLKVEEVFAAGELTRVAEILASMRRSLTKVGDVPEFRAGRQKLKALEDRLQNMIEGSLEEALTKTQDDAVVQKLAALLLAVDRYSTVETLYCNARLAAVHGMWEEASAAAPAASGVAGGADSLAWLSLFYNRLLTYLEGEARWLSKVLPEQLVSLFGALTSELLTKVSRAVRDRLAPTTSINALAGLLRQLASFGRSLHELLEGVAAEVRETALQALFLPLEDKVAAYGALEQAQLSSELAAILGGLAIAVVGIGGSSGSNSEEDAESVVKRLSLATRGVFACLHAALDRCLSFTGGSELRTLLQTLDSQLSSSLGRLQAPVAALHQRYSPAASAASSAHPTSTAGDAQLGISTSAATTAAAGGGGAQPVDPEELGNILRLVLVAKELSGQLTKLDAALRTAIATTVPRLQAACDSTRPVLADPVALRLTLHPEKLQRLQALADSVASDSRFLALPAATGSVEGFTQAVGAAVLEVVLATVRQQLAGFALLPEWRRNGGGSPGGLPSFNAYPLPYITAIGDYLMNMPQQLEVLMEEDGGNAGVSSSEAVLAEEDGDELAANWLDKVVSSSAVLYTDTALHLTELSASGGAQLAADVEYFCNVCSALHVSPPPPLLVLQLLAGTPGEGFAQAAAGALADAGNDPGVATALRALANMRGIALDF